MKKRKRGDKVSKQHILATALSVMKKHKKVATLSFIGILLVSAFFIYPYVKNPTIFGEFEEQSYLTKFNRTYSRLTGNWLMENEGYPDVWNVIWHGEDAKHVKPGESFDLGLKAKNHGTEGNGDNKGGISLFQATTNFHDSYNNIFKGGRETYWYTDNILLYPANEYVAKDGKPLYFVHEGDKKQGTLYPYDYYAYRKPKVCMIIFEEDRKYAEEIIEGEVYVWYLPALHQNGKEGNYVDLKLELSKARLIDQEIEDTSYFDDFIYYGIYKKDDFYEGETIQTHHIRVYCDYSLDTDGDGVPDTEDPDIDGDGIPNEEDDTPYGGKNGGPPTDDTELLLILVIGIAVVAGVLLVIIKKKRR